LWEANFDIARWKPCHTRSLTRIVTHQGVPSDIMEVEFLDSIKDCVEAFLGDTYLIIDARLFDILFICGIARTKQAVEVPDDQPPLSELQLMVSRPIICSLLFSTAAKLIVNWLFVKEEAEMAGFSETYAPPLFSSVKELGLRLNNDLLIVSEVILEQVVSRRRSRISCILSVSWTGKDITSWISQHRNEQLTSQQFQDCQCLPIHEIPG
jgi:hypothetical protein